MHLHFQIKSQSEIDMKLKNKTEQMFALEKEDVNALVQYVLLFITVILFIFVMFICSS